MNMVPCTPVSVPSVMFDEGVCVVVWCVGVWCVVLRCCVLCVVGMGSGAGWCVWGYVCGSEWRRAAEDGRWETGEDVRPHRHDFLLLERVNAPNTSQPL